MNKISAILVDDEVNNLENLAFLLKKHCPEVQIIAAISSPLEAVRLIDDLEPDLLFLDIKMPQMDGFQLLKQMGNTSFEVIFVTAFDQYALPAIKVCALDYLMKPILVEDLQSAVGKAIKKIESNHQNDRLAHLLQNLNYAHSSKLGVPNGDKVHFMPIRDILYCRGEINYTHIISLNSVKNTVSKTLKEYELLLSPHNFIRVHQSFLVNLEQVESFVRSDGGYFIMTDGFKIPLSRQRRKYVLDRLKAFGLIK